MYQSLNLLASQRIAELKDSELYRKFTQLSGSDEIQFPNFLTDENKVVMSFCSNDYLAMSRNRAGVRASMAAVLLDGLGAGGSRNIGGTRRLSDELEAELKSLHKCEAALTFNSGYLANFVPMKVISRVFNAIVFSDAQNHASIIDGLDTSKSGVDKFVFRHNDPVDLDRLLSEHSDSSRPAVVVFESLYSMEGDFAPLRELIQVAQDYRASVVLNEVHAVGVLGEEGSGCLSWESDLRANVDLITGTFGKGFGTVGGYVVGKGEIVDAIRSFGRGLIFTTAPPPSVLASTLANIRYLRGSNAERKRHQKLCKYIKKKFRKEEIPVVCEDSHIIAIRVGAESATLRLSEDLLADGFYVTPIRYPTVPRGDGRLRVTVTPAHTEEQIDQFVRSLKHNWPRPANIRTKSNTMKKYLVASRGSKLALIQTATVVAELRMRLKEILGPDAELPEFVIATHRAIGDKRRENWESAKLSMTDDERSRKWTLELEELVSANDADLAVHSGKDLPFRTFANTEYIPVMAREDERDVIIFRDDRHEISTLPPGFCIGTNSPRRRLNIKSINPELSFKEYSGNVTTRILPKTMTKKEVGAAVMAAAGLKRLGLYDQDIMHPIPVSDSLPCGNQGILAVQLNLSGDPLLKQAIEKLVDVPTLFAWHAERSFLEIFGATCESPISVHAQVESDEGSVRSCILRCCLPHSTSGQLVKLQEAGQFDKIADPDKVVEAARLMGSNLGQVALSYI